MHQTGRRTASGIELLVDGALTVLGKAGILCQNQDVLRAWLGRILATSMTEKALPPGDMIKDWPCYST